MKPAILRTALALALVFGVGIIANVFTNQGARLNERVAGQADGPQGDQGRKLPTSKLSREAEQRRVTESVRRQLVERGYLATDAISSVNSVIVTQAAILAFEFDYHLALTAEPSDTLQKALIFTHAKAQVQLLIAPKTESARRLIVEVQRALAHLGYGNADISGSLDQATRKAIQKFERARGLQMSGRISAPLIESLGPAMDLERVGGQHVAGRHGAG